MHLASRHQGTDTGLLPSVTLWNCETSSNVRHCGKGSDNGYVIPMRQLADPSAHHVGVSSTVAKFFKRNSRYAQAGAGLVCNLPSRTTGRWPCGFSKFPHIDAGSRVECMLKCPCGVMVQPGTPSLESQRRLYRGQCLVW
jgi:hypothetical protein